MLPLPLVAKDRLREIVADAFNVQTREESRALVAPTFAIYHGLLYELLKAGVGVVAECNYFRGVSEPELLPLAALGTPVIVHCQTSRELSVRRFVERHRQGLASRRYAFDGERIPALQAGALLDSWDRAEPVEIGAPVLRVNTTNGYEPSLDQIVSFIRSGGAPG